MMNRSKRWLCGALLWALISAACAAKNVVVRVPEAESNLKKDGVFYALPRTVVSVEVPVVRVDKKKGEYEKFAACFFPEDAKKIVDDEDPVFELSDPVVSSRGEPDPDEYFMVKTKSHYFEDRLMSLTVTQDGTMTKATAETTNRTVDLITQTAQTAASLVASGISAGFLDAAITDQDLKDLEEFFRTYSLDCINNETLKNDLKTLNKQLDRLAALKRKPDAEQETAEKDEEQSLPQKIKDAAKATKLTAALKAYKKIQALQQQRENSLTTSMTSTSGAVLPQWLVEMDKLIAAYKSKFFIGAKTSRSWNARFEITPVKGSLSRAETDYELFELSEEAGVCGVLLRDPAVTFPGLTIPPVFSLDCTGKSKEVVLLRLRRIDRQLATRISAAFNDRSEPGDRGFYYRIPAITNAGIFLGGAEIFRTKLTVAQLGQTVSLPASSGGRKTKYELELYETGAMKNFLLGSEAMIQSSNISGFGKAAQTVLEAQAQAAKAAAAAEAAAKDEFGKVKNLRALLEECEKIKKAQEALGRQVSLPKFCAQQAEER